LIRILLIDDHTVVRKGLRAILEAVDDFEIVADLESGIGLIDKLPDLNPDIIILDMEMPGRKGPDVAKDILQYDDSIKILALSAHDDYSFINRMLELGAVGYLNKDESVEILVDAVEGIANGETGLFSHSTLANMNNAKLYHLTEREIEVISLVAKGHDTTQIAELLGVGGSTVKTHLQRVYDKIDRRGMRETMLWAWNHGFKR
jgi:DNA-binding NarL/FixJ family response regulator